MYRRGPILLKRFKKTPNANTSVLSRLRPPFQNRKLSTSQSDKVDPKLLEKFKCHHTIPCGIPLSFEDINAAWHHIPDDLLPTNWSSNWLEFGCSPFLPDMCRTYSMGQSDIDFNAGYGIAYPMKGVMYCTVERVEPGGLFDKKLFGNAEGFVFQDAIGDFYYFYELWLGGDEFLAKFRAPRGTTVGDFVKHHFRGAVKGVDMDLVFLEAHRNTCYDILEKEQEDLAALQRQAATESRCACRTVRGLEQFLSFEPL